MRIRITSLMAACLTTCIILCGWPARAASAFPANLSEAKGTVRTQGIDRLATDYQWRSMISMPKPLEIAFKEGVVAAGKSGFDMIFVVATDGRIKASDTAARFS